MLSVKGLLAVLVTAGFLSVPIYMYWGFLTRGMQPSTSTQKLDQLEKNGVPDFSFPDLSGNQVKLSDFKGRPVIVNLWASWCAPCVKEFPSLKGLVEHYKGKMVVLAISHDRTKDDLESFINAFGSVPKDFVIVWDKERKSGEMLGTDQLPETYILNSDLKLVRKVVGEQVWDSPRALEFFGETLGIKQ
jgi:thiol-disulfide isomerase/thioredoxin